MTAPTAPEQVPPEAGTPESDPPEIDRPARQNQVKLKLEVVAGAHRGAVLLLDESDYRIGRSPDADIVLSDPGVAATHATLHVGRDRLTGRTMVHIGATGGDITVGQEKLPLSRGCRARLPVSVALGETRLQLSDSGTYGAGRAYVGKTLTAAGLVAGAAFATAVAVQTFRVSGPADAVAPERPASDQRPSAANASSAFDVATTTAGLVAGAAFATAMAVQTLRASGPAEGAAPERPGSDQRPSAANAASASDVAREEAARQLSARLDAAKITTLRISAEDGRVAATGTLTGQQAAEWGAIQRWFDQTYNGRIVLTTRIGPPEGPRAMPTLQIQAVWYGEHPYVLAADGEHYFKGAILNNGWMIRDIGEDRMLLAKDGEAVMLTYGLPSQQAPAPQAARTNE